MRAPSLGLVVLLSSLACQRTSNMNAAPDGGSGVENDAGSSGTSNPVDSGVPVSTAPDSGIEEYRNWQLCPADAGAPDVADGGFVWSDEVLPTVGEAQDAGWVTLSTDPECDAVKPGPVPRSLSWTVADGGAACDPARVDGRGSLAVDWLNNSGLSASMFSSDGAKAVAIHEGDTKASMTEQLRLLSVRANGFVMVGRVFNPSCYFLHPLDEGGTPTSSPIQTGIRNGEDLEMIFPNPLGGFVEVRQTVNGKMPPDTIVTLDTRYVDNNFMPLGDWQNVTTHGASNTSWALGVDQKGRALVLVFLYPPSFGPPPPPSEWTFLARWMGPSGALGDAFTPAAPTFTAKGSNTKLFAGWGTFLALPEGGFVLYRGPSDSSGTIAPSGWYAHYASAEQTLLPPPPWVSEYNGTLRTLAGGVGYSAIQYNAPDTCARTISMIAPSGRACFKLDLGETESCAGSPDSIWPDGTLILQGDASGSSCSLRWWPGLSRPAAR